MFANGIPGTPFNSLCINPSITTPRLFFLIFMSYTMDKRNFSYVSSLMNSQLCSSFSLLLITIALEIFHRHRTQGNNNTSMDVNYCIFYVTLWKVQVKIIRDRNLVFLNPLKYIKEKFTTLKLLIFLGCVCVKHQLSVRKKNISITLTIF